MKHRCYWCGKIKQCQKANLLYGHWVCKECNEKR
jgi:hypothetical protein